MVVNFFPKKAILKFLLYLVTVITIINVQICFAQTPDAEAEAEAGTIIGASVLTDLAGYSGTGYVGRFENSSDLLILKLNFSTAGLYELIIRYACPYGGKYADVDVNDAGYSKVELPSVATWDDVSAGKYSLVAGDNTIKIKPNWTWFLIDKVSAYKAELHDYTKVVTDLINPDADVNAYALYDFLRDNYSKKIISGQTAETYVEIEPITGRSPMLRVWDFSRFTVGYPYLWDNTLPGGGGHTLGWDGDNSSEEAIAWYNSTGKQGIVGYQWHWHSPSGGVAGQNNFYTRNTSFDVRQAVISGTAENTAILRDIDSIATQLKKFQAAGVPVLWRPLHEAGGGWFWWGAHGATPALQLWDIVYDRLTNYHHINNLIWVWSTPESDWFPGLSKIDIIGYDSYPGEYIYSPQSSMFNQLYDIVDGKKLVAMTENGPIPDPQACFDADSPWSFFMLWDNFYSTDNTNQHLIDVYSHPDVLSLGPGTAVPSVTYSNRKNIDFAYPNPSSDILNLKLGDRNLDLLIYNMDGRLILREKNTENKINICTLKNGMYTLVVQIGNTIYSTKFIKE